MKKRILLWVAWFLGVRKELEPIIKEGTELYKKAEKKVYAQKKKKERYEPPEYIISKIITLSNLLKESQ